MGAWQHARRFPHDPGRDSLVKHGKMRRGEMGIKCRPVAVDFVQEHLGRIGRVDAHVKLAATRLVFDGRNTAGSDRR